MDCSAKPRMNEMIYICIQGVNLGTQVGWTHSGTNKPDAGYQLDLLLADKVLEDTTEQGERRQQDQRL
jgi:hypothetical protein